jgi:hypothetical protein
MKARAKTPGFSYGAIMSGQKQHVDIHRKLTLRQTLIDKAGNLPGAYYVPFIGEGDIAVALYGGKRVFGADTSAAMVKTARERLPDAQIIKADCDEFPFNKGTATFSLDDFDAYSYPYQSFRSFWKGAKIGSHAVIIFTDGQKQAIIRTGHYRTPDGEKHHLTKITDKREAFNFYYTKGLLPWFKEYIKPWKVIYHTKYSRGPSQLYWGAVIVKPGNGNGNGNGKKTNGENGSIKSYKCDDTKKTAYLEHISNGHTRGYAATLVGLHRTTILRHMKDDKDFAQAVTEAEADAIGKIENALFEAAQSGNVTAIQVFLYNRDPKRWSDKRNVQLAGEGGGPIKVEVDGRAKLISALNRLATRVREGEDSRPDDGGGGG